MSRIYDALVRAGKNRDSKVVLSQPRREVNSGPLDFWWQAASLDRKIFAVVATVMAVSGLLLVVILHQLMGRALRTQIDQRGRIVAASLSDAAAGYVAGKNVLELDALIAKFARLDGVAYAFIENRTGQILIHSSRRIPPGFQSILTTGAQDLSGRRVIDAEGRTVYDFRAPILEGQLGTAHLGIWAADVEAQVNGSLVLAIGTIILIVLGSLVLTFYLVRMIAGPSSAPSDAADEISGSDPDSPVSTRAVG